MAEWIGAALSGLGWAIAIVWAVRRRERAFLVVVALLIAAWFSAMYEIPSTNELFRAAAFVGSILVALIGYIILAVALVRVALIETHRAVRRQS